MFGLTEDEMNKYIETIQNYAVEEVSPNIVSKAGIMSPAFQEGSKLEPDWVFINVMRMDIEHIITLTASLMAYDYAYLQCESDLEESEIASKLHDKYVEQLYMQFIKYSISLNSDICNTIVGEIILELPHIYIGITSDDEDEIDDSLEEKLYDYNDYLDENFPDYLDDYDDFDDYDDYDNFDDDFEDNDDNDNNDEDDKDDKKGGEDGKNNRKEGGNDK